MIKTRRTKRTFSPEFKLEAIEQVVKYQRDVREVAQSTRCCARVALMQAGGWLDD